MKHILLGTLALGAVAVAASSPSQPKQATPSPSADVELICHTDNPAECYPKVFQATDEFRIVHDDQDLPSGLHVRLNVHTGLKEAKINVPDEGNPALEGLPVDSSIVIVEPETDADAEHGVKPKIPPNAPAYDPVGKIKKPKAPTPEDDGKGSGAFYKSLEILKKGLDIDEALEMLEDISHDIYYGLKIAEDYDTVRQLFCLANPGDIFAEGKEVLSRARLAALTIGSAVQNNPKALAEIEAHWAKLQKEICSGSSEALGTAVFRLVPESKAEGARNDPALAKVRVAAISGLLKNDVIRRDFLANGGMDLLLEVLAVPEEGKEEWEPAQRKVGLLVLDNFLDENMGATLGEWPTGDEGSTASWGQHAMKLAHRYRHEKDHWSGELWKKLQEQTKINRSGKEKTGKEEL
ncbi:hypothetical protein QBC46DRAFT_394954 [Diplogelasinospora grovesii]|uniref:Nucleotide exchange factor SIL1 n=1 Tax=Diplogelasinospora grovesii TaxID=303347 RepID=A0AAN6S106_9PEZI|nr:hypothetical protein QBC46DRAFT_394954 [Diplogelasinospora grovesii]